MCFIFVLHFDGLILCSCTQINARIVFCKISQIRIGFGFSSTQVSDFFFSWYFGTCIFGFSLLISGFRGLGRRERGSATCLGMTPTWCLHDQPLLGE